MLKGCNNKLTGQVGEFLVCAELGRRGLIATPFAGNVPAFDVLAADELCRTVPIQVKTSSSDNWPADARHWMDIEFDKATKRQNYGRPAKIENPNLIYVCVAIAAPTKSDARDRFFVLTKSEVQNAIIEGYSEWMDKRDWVRPRNPESYDARYFLKTIKQYENRWELITQRLESIQSSSALESDQE